MVNEISPDQIEEFEEFVESITSQMSDIMTGKAPPPTCSREFTQERTSLQKNVKTKTLPNKKNTKSLTENKSNENQLTVENQKKTNGIDYSKWDNIQTEDENSSDSQYEEYEGSSEESEEDDEDGDAESGFIHGIGIGFQEKESERSLFVKKQADNFKVAGNNAYKAGKYNNAITFYDKAIQVYETANNIQRPEAKTKDLGNDFMAFMDYMAGPCKIPVDPILYRNRAQAYLKLSMFDTALKDCEAALQFDPNNIKAIWRKIEALRGLKDFPNALLELRKLVEKYKKNELDVSVISYDDITKNIKLVAQESFHHDAEKNLSQMMDSDGTKVFLDKIFKAMEKYLIEFKKQSEKSQSLEVSCSVLVKWLYSHPNIADGFRISNGFSRLVKHIDKNNLQILLPVFIATVEQNEANRASLGSLLPSILSVLPDIPNISQLQTIASLVTLIGICCQDPQVCSLMSMQNRSQWTECLGVSTMAILSIDRNSSKQTRHVYHALLFVSNLISLRKGFESLFRVYKVELGHLLLGIAKTLCLDKMEGHDKSFLHMSSSCLRVILSNDCPKQTESLNNSMHDLCKSLFTVISECPPSDELLYLFHNLLIYLDHSISDLIVQFNIPFYLYSLYTSDTVKYEICLGILSKLAKFHSRQIAHSVDIDWSDEELKKVILSKIPKVSKAGLQILACWLQASETHVLHWMKQSGFELLVWIVRNENTKGTMDGYIVGNAALCLGECCRKAEHARLLVRLEVVDPIIQLLRKSNESGVQRNLAIVAARLCQVVEGLEKIRALKGIELMYNLGSRIVGLK